MEDFPLSTRQNPDGIRTVSSSRARLLNGFAGREGEGRGKGERATGGGVLVRLLRSGSGALNLRYYCSSIGNKKRAQCVVEA